MREGDKGLRKNFEKTLFERKNTKCLENKKNSTVDCKRDLFIK